SIVRTWTFMDREDPKIIVITGATRGLGRALTVEFAALGHRVIGCGRSRGHVASLEQELSAPHEFAVVDVSSDSELNWWAKRVLEEYGPPDLLLNNAAIMNPVGPLWEITAREFDSVVDVNVKGVVNVIRHFVPAMIARHSGVIVNFSSGWGRST